MRLLFRIVFLMIVLMGTGSQVIQASPYASEVEILKTKVKNRQDVIDLIGKPSKVKKNPRDAFSEELIYRRRRLGTNHGSGVSGSVISKCFSVAESGQRQILNRLASPLCFVAAVPLSAAGTVGGWLLPGESKRLSVFLDSKSLPIYYEVRGTDFFERGVLDPEKVMLLELMKKDPQEQDRILAEMVAKQKETTVKAQEVAQQAQAEVGQIKKALELAPEPTAAPGVQGKVIPPANPQTVSKG